jgi:hypothetical protein
MKKQVTKAEQEIVVLKKQLKQLSDRNKFLEDETRIMVIKIKGYIKVTKSVVGFFNTMNKVTPYINQMIPYMEQEVNNWHFKPKNKTKQK